MYKPLSKVEFNNALIELRKRTSFIISLMYHTKPSEVRNRRNQRNKRK